MSRVGWRQGTLDAERPLCAVESPAQGRHACAVGLLVPRDWRPKRSEEQEQPGLMKPRSKEPIRVGVLFSQTGVTSVIENSERLATILAAEEINQAGGINGRELQLLSLRPRVAAGPLPGAGGKADARGRRAHHPRVLHVEHAQGRDPGGGTVERAAPLSHALRGLRVLAQRVLHRRRAQSEQRATRRVHAGPLRQPGADGGLGLHLSVRVQPHHERSDPRARRGKGGGGIPAAGRSHGRIFSPSPRRSRTPIPTSSSRPW